MELLKLNSGLVNEKGQEIKKQLNVLVALCVHRGVDPDMVEKLLFLQQCPEPRITIKVKSGDALIDRSRAIVASRFYEAKYDVLFFIDDDIVFNPYDIARMTLNMERLNLDILGGAYVKKQEKGTHFAIKTFDDRAYSFGDDAPIQEVEMVSTGFMAIHRRVIEKMVSEKVVPLCHVKDLRFYPFFKPEEKQLADGNYVYLSEDWAFCERAKKLGFRIHVDGSVKLGHAGRYVYNWDDIFRLQNAKQAIPHLTYQTGENYIRSDAHMDRKPSFEVISDTEPSESRP